MFPPLIWLAFVILLVAVIAIGALWAVRAGLWARETSTSGDNVEGEKRFEKRPEHTKVDEPGNQTYIGT
ncbi:hypothetical protein [Capillimicrobium parvum]|uniref:Uncharacterized protein n=1 Tax=Capillimicrobium parvum TaxID=2884022 RepID=A0A9E6XYP9_9ACTN|nr:hypothetical protein [Capillimicrobium parvum]UGS36859.1 hypothetical protein DSM104329_03270 [Capillimicrobium parvum]